ncbi:deoxyribodipyrimidine photo-lyase [Natrarchaeobius halalkaliphilus]|uniref:Deoxyribodipyrimidine photo-lyase n=1 Tax=Natrarchaeobius halalkaliphilus TaxID=1679091 RepID=A0A3N6LRK7_9EURY|nr:deoxyribodipyrimidine photo-lyase [Natrarchaeobius halalkaliphilus]RQG89774.1 deoxyribodipyrimidine photo-lyase [Natrarchaeobius halalkaliphilus]
MGIHWHRRDLRTSDNLSLARAAESGDPVVPLFVFDPTILEHATPPRVACLREAVGALREWYLDLGSDLLVEYGEPSDVLPRVAAAYDADAVYWNEDYSGLAGERDRAVTAALEDEGFVCKTAHDAIHHEPGSITPNSGDHYSIFSYFWKKWRDRDKREPVDPPEPTDLAAVPSADDEVSTDSESIEGIPSLSDLGFEEPDATLPTVTPSAARERVSSFCSGPIYEYEGTRDYPATGGTSRLSVHLKWGTIGVRELFEATQRAADRASSTTDRESVESFQRQLAWREFYAHVLSYNPGTVAENFSQFDREIQWRDDPDELEAWRNGGTGYPIVDAGMRQLVDDGWMHNRVRMLVASFLTKDLLIDWREGYDWFRRKLADHDTANDVGGWQWAGSTGTDAQPYFRVFNPMKQGREYDPDAEYIRAYVPELEAATPDRIHGWHELSGTERERVAPSYPAPIVDHAERRERAIATFKRAKGTE